MFEKAFPEQNQDENNNSNKFLEASVVFVSDLFSDDHLGGAELTTDSLIETCPFSIFKIRASELTSDIIKAGTSKYWIFGNFSHLKKELIPEIVSQLRYSIIEYDYKYCKYRSPEKHKEAEGIDCNCNNDMIGKMVSAFMYGSKSLWWMSENQMNHYHSKFPFLSENKNTVLSSIFSESFFDKIESLNKKFSKKEKSGHLVVGSSSWIKGTEDSVKWCDDNNVQYKVVENLSYDSLLEELAKSETLVFLPRGSDTCPRLVIEAKLLGCKLIINENVQHANEAWFDTDSIDDILSYLLLSHSRFWDDIEKEMNYTPTISGYTQAYNCLSSNYPWRESIGSLLGFCDEVVVLDGGSDDGTYEELIEWQKNDKRLKIKQIKRDWNSKKFALFNGQQKAIARAYCTSEWCWQVDIDEVVHEDDYEKIKNLLTQLPKNVELVALPLIEYWGGPDKVRVDVNPWKWRLSKNKPHITHGLPRAHRKFDENGDIFSAGSDGDDYIRSDTFENIQCATFYTSEIDDIRNAALGSTIDSPELKRYQEVYSVIVNNLPGVHHYSWFDMKRKVLSYRDFWSKHWASLYNRPVEDIPENNKFFNKKWSDVTDEEVNKISARLSEEMGGWIFHNRVDFSKKTPWVNIERSHPSLMKDWIKDHSRSNSEG